VNLEDFALMALHWLEQRWRFNLWKLVFAVLCA